MQIDTGTVFGIIGSIMAALASAYVGLVKYTIGLRDKELERRFEEANKLDDSKQKETDRRLNAAESSREECAKETKAILERLRLDELETVRLRGEFNSLSNQHTHMARDIEDIKEMQVPRAEWEREMTHVREDISTIKDGMQTLLKQSGRYQQSSYGGSRSTSDPSVPAQRTDKR